MSQAIWVLKWAAAQICRIVAGVGHAPLDVDLGTNPLPVLLIEDGARCWFLIWTMAWRLDRCPDLESSADGSGCGRLGCWEHVGLAAVIAVERPELLKMKMGCLRSAPITDVAGFGAAMEDAVG
ncbi:hypothetical protein ACLOJK_004573 [Asimina triloba]